MKKRIGEEVRAEMDLQKTSLRKLSKEVNVLPYLIHKVTSGDSNYNIDTLTKVLDGLGLELKVVKKRGSD